MTTIPLARASLCLDCERIRPSTEQYCPVCGSHQAVLLARWLNRAPVEAPQCEWCDGRPAPGFTIERSVSEGGARLCAACRAYVAYRDGEGE